MRSLGLRVLGALLVVVGVSCTEEASDPADADKVVVTPAAEPTTAPPEEPPPASPPPTEQPAAAEPPAWTHGEKQAALRRTSELAIEMTKERDKASRVLGISVGEAGLVALCGSSRETPPVPHPGPKGPNAQQAAGLLAMYCGKLSTPEGAAALRRQMLEASDAGPKPERRDEEPERRDEEREDEDDPPSEEADPSAE